MPYHVRELDAADVHHWGVVDAGACDLNDAHDPLVAETVAAVQHSYGEDRILQLASDLADGSRDGELTFDLAHLRAAVRLGLPDPAAEGSKPEALTVYRSQSAEMVAKGALAIAFGFSYPAAPQQGSVNPNQPILGFDSWGIHDGEPQGPALVLIQVKATDQETCPPGQAAILAEECRHAIHQRSALSRTLLLKLQFVNDTGLQLYLMQMLEALGRGGEIRILVAPVIVRGTSEAHMTDLQPLRDAASDFLPALGRGLVVRIGVPLAAFGRVVMNRARGDA